MKHGAQLGELIAQGIAKFIKSGQARSKSEVARMLEVAPSSITDWERSGKISREHFFSLACLLRNTVATGHWFDERKMSDTLQDMINAASQQSASHVEAFRIDVSIAPGCCATDDRQPTEQGAVQYQFFKHAGWLQQTGLSADSLIAVSIDGGLLSDTLNHRDIAVFDTRQTALAIDAIYLFSTPTGWIVRRYTGHDHGAGNPAALTAGQIGKSIMVLGRLVYREGTVS